MPERQISSLDDFKFGERKSCRRPQQHEFKAPVLSNKHKLYKYKTHDLLFNVNNECLSEYLAVNDLNVERLKLQLMSNEIIDNFGNYRQQIDFQKIASELANGSIISNNGNKIQIFHLLEKKSDNEQLIDRFDETINELNDLNTNRKQYQMTSFEELTYARQMMTKLNELNSTIIDSSVDASETLTLWMTKINRVSKWLDNVHSLVSNLIVNEYNDEYIYDTDTAIKNTIYYYTDISEMPQLWRIVIFITLWLMELIANDKNNIQTIHNFEMNIKLWDQFASNILNKLEVLETELNNLMNNKNIDIENNVTTQDKLIDTLKHQNDQLLNQLKKVKIEKLEIMKNYKSNIVALEQEKALIYAELVKKNDLYSSYEQLKLQNEQSETLNNVGNQLLFDYSQIFSDLALYKTNESIVCYDIVQKIKSLEQLSNTCKQSLNSKVKEYLTINEQKIFQMKNNIDDFMQVYNKKKEEMKLIE